MNNINFEVVAIEILLPDTTSINMISIYSPPQIIIKLHNWQALINQLTGEGVISGDFNSHSPAWGCTFEDQAGKNIIDNIDNYSVVILNNGSNTMLPHPFRNASPVDLTISSPLLVPSLAWEVYGEN